MARPANESQRRWWRGRRSGRQVYSHRHDRLSIHIVRNRIVSGVFWLASAKAVAQLVTWVISIVVVRLLSPQDYGLMGMAVLFTGFLLLFNELGLGAAMIQRLDLKDEQISSLRYVILGVNVVLFVFILICAPLVAGYFDEPGLIPIVRVLG